MLFGASFSPPYPSLFQTGFFECLITPRGTNRSPSNRSPRPGPNHADLPGEGRSNLPLEVLRGFAGFVGDLLVGSKKVFGPKGPWGILGIKIEWVGLGPEVAKPLGLTSGCQLGHLL